MMQPGVRQSFDSDMRYEVVQLSLEEAIAEALKDQHVFLIELDAYRMSEILYMSLDEIIRTSADNNVVFILVKERKE